MYCCLLLLTDKNHLLKTTELLVSGNDAIKHAFITNVSNRIFDSESRKVIITVIAHSARFTYNLRAKNTYKLW